MLVKRPIYDQKLKCVAFEILSHQYAMPTEDIKRMLHDLIKNADTQLPLFIPYLFKSSLMEFDIPIENSIILKLDAQDIETLYSIQELQESLFSIALLINSPQQLTWLNFADYVGLTEELMNSEDLTKVVQFSKAKQRKVMAYGLENPISFDKCKDMGMDYYCGDFLYRPTPSEQADLATNKLNALHLIQALQQEDCDLMGVSDIIKTDPLLSFQVLKVVNSAGLSRSGTIDSIDQAINRLGIILLKNWVMVLSIKNISDKPIEILESGLIRAYMAESIAKLHPGLSPQSAYTVGLLSVLDSLLNRPMNELLAQINLNDDIKEALMTQSGPLGPLLALVSAYEVGHWEHISEPLYEDVDLSKLYIESLTLVSKNTKAMMG